MLGGLCRTDLGVKETSNWLTHGNDSHIATSHHTQAVRQFQRHSGQLTVSFIR